MRGVGGLADTVIDVNAASLADSSATGFVFAEASVSALVETLKRAIDFYQDPPAWKRLALAGMAKNYTWRTSAEQYLHLYGTLIATRT